MENQLIQNSMQIILHAGDARLKCKEALDFVEQFDFESARKCMKEAQREISKAHKIQTDAIQEETRGMKKEYSLLFAHAQDTLMTIYSELNITKKLIMVFTAYEKRLQNIEKSIQD